MLAHNGNLVNALELRKELEYTGAIFQTTIDSEVIAYHIARERLKTGTCRRSCEKKCYEEVKGSLFPGYFQPEKNSSVPGIHLASVHW